MRKASDNSLMTIGGKELTKEQIAANPSLMGRAILEAIDRERCFTPLVVGGRYRYNGHVVEVVDGQYWGAAGLSNFWTWRRVLDNGKLGRAVSGYDQGGFTKL